MIEKLEKHASDADRSRWRNGWTDYDIAMADMADLLRDAAKYIREHP